MTRLRLTAAIVLVAVPALLMSVFASSPATATERSVGAKAETDTDYGRMILVLDSSGSMAERTSGGTTKIAAAKTALDKVVGGLPDEAYVGLRVYGATVFAKSQKGACTDSQLVVKPGTDNRDQLASAISKYKPYGETPIAYSLQQAAKDIGSEGKRSIVLVSDGEATCAPDPCVVAGKLAAAGIDLQIDVVGLSVNGKAKEQLQCVAAKGNGTYYDVDSADEITQSLSRVTNRAVRPFTVSGRPITGATDKEQATPITEGDWSDTLAPKASSRGKLYYVYDRKKAGSTLRFSASTPGDVGEWDGVQMSVTSLDEENTFPCDTAIDYRSIDTTSVVGDEALVDPTSSCGKADKYLLEVSRWLSASASIPIGIRVSEEPALKDAGEPATASKATATAPQVEGAAKPVTGGSSFTDAAEVGNGRWSTTIVPGEAQMFRVPLEFGQAARVRVHFPEATAAVRKITGYSGPFVTMKLYNPMRGALTQADDAERTGTLPGAKAVDLLDALPPVSRDLADTDGYDFSMAGSYYIGLSVATRDETYEVPYTLEVQVIGDKGESPTYADGGTWSVEKLIRDATEANGSRSSDGDQQAVVGKGKPKAAATDDGGLSTRAKLGAAGGLGVIALGCLAAALMFLRRPN